jgi:hypothetical protein
VDDARVQVHDRSPLCTVALAQYLRHPVTPLLAGEVARMIREQMYEQPVFLLCPLGFIKPTAARRISYADSVEFGAMHEQVYLEYGFDIVHVTAGTATSRAAALADLSSEPACEFWHGTGLAGGVATYPAALPGLRCAAAVGQHDLAPPDDERGQP